MSDVKVLEGDCLNLLQGIDSKSIDMIYLDPPFFTGKVFSGISKDNLTQYFFKDTWIDSSEYKLFLQERLTLCKKVMKDTGSIFVHCDRNATHLIRDLLDQIFGQDNFQSEIIWYYKRWSNAKKGLLNQHQNILFYSKSKKFKWNNKFVDYSATTNIDQILQKRQRNEVGTAVYATTSDGEVINGGSKKGVPLGDVWEIPFLNPKAKERTGYPTQKPLILLERIIELVTDEGDMVLDPFCGSGTTLVASKLLKRHAIGIEISKEAVNLAQERLASLVKTESHLMNKGIESYKNNDPWVEKHLASFEYVRVHRNKGLDGLLKQEGNDKAIFLKVQKESESLEDAYQLMEQALKSKYQSSGILIQTKSDRLNCEKSAKIKVIKSLDCQLSDF